MAAAGAGAGQGAGATHPGQGTTPRRVVTLSVISDVPGDDPAIIASGRTVPDTSTFADALAVLEKYSITEPRAVIDHLKRGADETPKPGDPRLAHATTQMIATPQLSLEAVAGVARQTGVTPLILGDALEGESREVAALWLGLPEQIVLHGQPVPSPAVLLSGWRNDGHGQGTCIEFSVLEI